MRRMYKFGNMHSVITFFKLLPQRPGANELNGLLMTWRLRVKRRGLRHAFVVFDTNLFLCHFSPLFGYNVYNDGHFYLFPNSSLSWHDARDACADQGGHLVEIGSGAEQTLLEGIIAQSKCHQKRCVCVFVTFYQTYAVLSCVCFNSYMYTARGNC